MQLVFLGAPGSGKGTQAARLVENKGYNHVSTGDLLRAEIKKESELGQKVKGILAAGQLVDDETVLQLLKANCDVTNSSYIFDGYPRNHEQAKALDVRIIEKNPVKAVYFKADIEKVVARLTNRRTCASCKAIFNLQTLPPKKEGVCDKCGGTLEHRSDDKEEVIRDRMMVYENNIAPVLEYYTEKGVLETIDATREIDLVYKDLEALL